MSRLCLVLNLTAALCHTLPTARDSQTSCHFRHPESNIMQFYSSQSDICKSSKQSPELQAIVLNTCFLNPIKCNHSKHLKNIKAVKIEHWAKCIAAQKVPYKGTVLLNVTNFGGFVNCRFKRSGFHAGESFGRMSECYLFSWVMRVKHLSPLCYWVNIFLFVESFSLFVVALLFLQLSNILKFQLSLFKSNFNSIFAPCKHFCTFSFCI